MKKFGYLMGAALLTLGSCTNEINEEGFVDKANTISFNAYSNKTRAVTGDVTSANMKNDNFGVVGYNGSSIYLGSSNAAIQQTWKADGNVTGGGSWEYNNQSDLKFWPSSGTMQFFAYFPFSDNATFSESISENGTVMTIPNLTCNHDVLFASTDKLYYKERVPLTFYHAFSKIESLNVEIKGGNVESAGVSIEIQKVEFINTSTSGSVLVYNSGIASYTAASPNVTLSKDFTSSTKTVNSTSKTAELINNTGKAEGYIFATNSSSSETNPVKGTGKTLWNGTKNVLNSSTLSSGNFACLKLTCKVKDNTQHYLVGDENTFKEMYIPLTGTDSNHSEITSFIAGKRYKYNIVWEHNVGFTDAGDPILRPILFKVESVTDWEDVIVTITL
ncbi:MAG: fimbrillin family protein [Prevotella sp.]|nr:fimbrillin family protein [Prevotella sp.]